MPLNVPANPAHAKFRTGARPTPPHKIVRALLSGALRVHAPRAAPAQVAMVPAKLNMEGNDQHGDCVTAEEAAAISAYSVLLGLPEATVAAATAIQWATDHGVLEGADLLSVIQGMQKDGMQDDAGFLCKDGTPATVDFSNESALQSAIAQGPVKIGIGSSALPSGAGNQSGWTAFGNQGGANAEDHCVGLWGYGPVPWLAQQLGVQPPAGAPPSGYLLYTWGTIGIVDHPWILGATGEAYLRTPTTMGLGPLPPPPGPSPIPPPGPTPVPPPTPTPGAFAATLAVTAPADAAGTYTLGAAPTPDQLALIQQIHDDAMKLGAQGIRPWATVNWNQLWTDVQKAIADLQAGRWIVLLTVDLPAVVADLRS